MNCLLLQDYLLLLLWLMLVLHFRWISLAEYDGLRSSLSLHYLLLRLEIYLLELSDGRTSCRRGGDEDLLLLLLLLMLLLQLRLLVKLEDLYLLRLRLRFGVELRLERLLVEGGRCDRVEDAANGESVRHRVQLMLLLLLLLPIRLLNKELVRDGHSLVLISRW